jgi:hypothetical protein
MPIKYFSKNKNFYPVLILSNIGVIFSLTYIVRFTLTSIINLIFSLRLNTEQIVGYNQFTMDFSYSYVCGLIALIESAILIFTYIIVVEKANKILDYVATNFILEIAVICLFKGFPNTFSFWLFSIIKVAVTTLVAEYISLKIEQKEITINSNFIAGTI